MEQLPRVAWWHHHVACVEDLFCYLASCAEWLCVVLLCLFSQWDFECSCACRDIDMNIVDATELFVLDWLSWMAYFSQSYFGLCPNLGCHMLGVVRSAETCPAHTWQRLDDSLVSLVNSLLSCVVQLLAYGECDVISRTPHTSTSHAQLMRLLPLLSPTSCTLTHPPNNRPPLSRSLLPP
jgi:hypothetical protein